MTDLVRDFAVFDGDEVAAAFVHETGAMAEATVLVDGMRCASCGLAIEKALRQLDSDVEARINPATRHVHLRWDPRTCRLGQLMATIAQCGFEPHPLRHDTFERLGRTEFHGALRRLVVGGLGMMQVMTYAVATYAGAFDSMSATFIEFFRLLSLLVATPVVFYAAAPFFRGAARDLARRRVGMDVPVALAIGLAYTASVGIVLFGPPDAEVYFDSVVMFTFFLSCGRFVEMVARHRAQSAAEALAATLPATAQKIMDDGATVIVPIERLAPGDRILVNTGETVPADGAIAHGESSVDESLLTGESAARHRGPGDAVHAGSINLEGPLEVQVRRVGADTMLSGIARLLERAQGERPRIARLADRIAGRFVAAVLLLAAVVGAVWLAIDPPSALPVALSVLVVTCPCALSLATPAALTAATGRLSRSGVLVTRATALERLARIDTIILDKTGTLTAGRLELVRVRCLDPTTSDERCRELAAALEAGSSHPVANALADASYRSAACDLRTQPGRGIEGEIDGQRYRIGTLEYVTELTQSGDVDAPAAEDAHTRVYLGSVHGLLAEFTLADSLRADAAATLKALRERGLNLTMLSGDGVAPVTEVAAALGITDYESGMRPEQKLAALRRRRDHGRLVAMVGDGINDAPVLAGADVSIAMGTGAALAQASADLVLIGGDLGRLPDAIDTARATLRVIHQNLAWAVGYNALALPLAAAGLVAPWMAAIGMSVSSLVVVFNALRLGREHRDRGQASVAETPVLPAMSGP